jgi:hypothetical protein
VLHCCTPCCYPMSASLLSDRFMLSVEAGYKSNPYHNKTHVAHVLHRMHMILTRGGFRPHYVDSPSLLACLLSAVCCRTLYRQA